MAARVKQEARDIRDKYIAPPYSTDFGILYLPLEGLFAEVTSVPGLLSELQQKYRVTVAGPTTLAALINSLLMGFRTLMVEKKTSEVWRFVVRIQQDMESFDLAVDRAQKNRRCGFCLGGRIPAFQNPEGPSCPSRKIFKCS